MKLILERFNQAMREGNGDPSRDFKSALKAAKYIFAWVSWDSDDGAYLRVSKVDTKWAWREAGGPPGSWRFKEEELELYIN